MHLDAVKVAHHGSSDNTTHGLADFGARDYLIRTNGGSTYHHPKPQTLARLIYQVPIAPTFYFNYSTERTRAWAALAAKLENTTESFRVLQPPADEPGYVYELQGEPPS